MKYVHAGVVEGHCGIVTFSFFVFNRLNICFGEKSPIKFRFLIFLKTSRHLESCKHIPRLNCSWNCWINFDYRLIPSGTNFRTVRGRPKNCFWKIIFALKFFLAGQGSNSLLIVKALNNLWATYDLNFLRLIHFFNTCGDTGMWNCDKFFAMTKWWLWTKTAELSMLPGTSSWELESTVRVMRLKTIRSKCSRNPDAPIDSVNGKRLVCYFDCFFARFNWFFKA